MKYQLRIDDDLWRKFKSAAALKGISIKALCIELIQKWLNEGEKKG